MELKPILEEATAEGIRARDNATIRLKEKAHKAGRTEEDICGFSWICISDDFHIKVDKLNLEEVSTYQGPEGWRLDLKKVISYHRLWASLEGLAAAAAVLRRHGIKAVQEGTPD